MAISERARKMITLRERTISVCWCSSLKCWGNVEKVMIVCVVKDAELVMVVESNGKERGSKSSESFEYRQFWLSPTIT